MSTTQTRTVEAHELSEPVRWGEQTGSSPTNPERPPTTATNRLDKATYLKFISASFSFLVAGVNDGSVGALIPYVIRDYQVNTAIVSSIYAATFAGWLLAALSNTHLCQYFDLGSMLALGAAVQILAHALRAWMPPFGLFVVTFFFAALGQAYNDTQANTFVAATKGAAHRWLAVIHASYMAGCLMGPFIATAVASSAPEGGPSRWYMFYTFPVGISVANLALISWVFRDTLRIKRKTSTPASTVELGQGTGESQAASRNNEASKLIKLTLTSPSVWLLSVFYFFYIGSQITMGGWVVEYLVEVRDGDLSKMGFVPAGLSGGCLLGRLLLAEPTYRLGERRMVFIYCLLGVGLQILFWLVPNIIAASIAVSFIGFFTGPIFATGVSLGSKLFPPEIHPTALSFVFVFAQMGGSLFPIVTGVIASRVGVHVLQPILTGLLTATAISWTPLLRRKAFNNPALHQE